MEIIRRDKKTSISYLQRKMRIGYNKAANIIEELEDIGFLSPADHTGKREILDDIYKNSEESQ
jgi:S-DNA-T family DNA segregation ATPase FtsK/SpoIIIE